MEVNVTGGASLPLDHGPKHAHVVRSMIRGKLDDAISSGSDYVRGGH
jgi:hypothetical protein